MTNNPKLNIVLLIACLIAPAMVFAADPVYTGFFNNKAVGGYDPVSYFTEGKPVKGNKRFQINHKGADWYFSSQDNLEAFSKAPEKYAPQYGGYCAWAVGHDITAKGDPLQWSIVEDKLYLNIDADIKAQWLKDKEHWIKQGDKHWPSVLN